MPVVNYHSANGRLIGETTSGVRTDYMSDALGSVTGTLNASQAVVNTFRYKPYGELLAKTGSAADPAFMWNGTTQSRRTGLIFSDQYNRARHYGTRQGQWTTVDPFWPRECAYGYAGAAPGSNLDPSGLLPIRFEYNAFIPRRIGSLSYKSKSYVPAGLDYVRQAFTPWTHGHTDERGFTMSSAEARRAGRQAKIWAWATIDSEAIGSADPATSIKNGPSKALSTKSTPHNEAYSDGVVGHWQNIVRTGHEPEKCVSWAAFELQVCSPFIPTQFQQHNLCINFIVYVRFLAVNDRVHVTIEHSHDRFPDHEAFVFEPGFCSLLRYATPYTEISQGGLGQSTRPSIASCSMTAPTPKCKCKYE